MQCFQKDPTLRKTAKNLINHPWVKPRADRPVSMAMNDPLSIPQTARPSTHRPSVIKPAVEPAKAVEPPKVDKQKLLKPDDDDDWGETEPVKITLGNDKPAVVSPADKPVIPTLALNKQGSRQSLSTKDALLAKFTEDEDDGWDTDVADKPKPKLELPSTTTEVKPIIPAVAPKKVFKSDDDDDFGSAFNDVPELKLNLAPKLDTKDLPDDEDDEALFDDDMEFGDLENFTISQKAMEQNVQQEVQQKINQLKYTADNQSIENICQSLLNLLNSNMEIKNKITQAQWAMPIMEMLTYGNAAIMHIVLEVVNLVCHKNLQSYNLSNSLFIKTLPSKKPCASLVPCPL